MDTLVVFGNPVGESPWSPASVTAAFSAAAAVGALIATQRQVAFQRHQLRIEMYHLRKDAYLALNRVAQQNEDAIWSKETADDLAIIKRDAHWLFPAQAAALISACADLYIKAAPPKREDYETDSAFTHAGLVYPDNYKVAMQRFERCYVRLSQTFNELLSIHEEPMTVWDRIASWLKPGRIS